MTELGLFGQTEMKEADEEYITAAFYEVCLLLHRDMRGIISHLYTILVMSFLAINAFVTS